MSGGSPRGRSGRFAALVAALLLLLLLRAGFAGPGGAAQAQPPTDTPVAQESAPVPSPLPGPPADPDDPRNAPPAALGSPAAQAAGRATFAAYELAGLPQPGEPYADYLKRIGSISWCDQTRGGVVRNLNGQDVQLQPDECAYGSISGSGAIAIRGPDDRHGVLQSDGTVRYSDQRVVPMATPTDAEIAARRQRVLDDAQRALAELERLEQLGQATLPPSP